MAPKNRFALWPKYFITALVVGILVETIAWLGGFYRFHPDWLVLFIIIVVFGLLFATLAKVYKKKSILMQFFIGTLAAGAIEAFNALQISTQYYWVFAEGWPLGITNTWIRTVLLSLPGGIFILLLNLLVDRNIHEKVPPSA